MKVVLDTNVFVSAVMSVDGASRAVLRLCMDGELQPLMSNALLSEYEDVCGRRELFERSPIPELVRAELLDAFLACCIWVNIYYLWRPNSPDEADNHVIELAVGGGARTIITANKRDFMSTELLFPGLGISTPTEFMSKRKRQ